MATHRAKAARKAFEEKFFAPGHRYGINATYIDRSDRVPAGYDVKANLESLEGRVDDVIVAHVDRLPGPYSRLPEKVDGVPIVYVRVPRYELEF